MNLIAAILVIVIIAALGSAYLLSAGFSPSQTTSTTTTRPCVQKAYVGGALYCFSVTKAVTNASQAMILGAQTMYVVTYPQLNSACAGNLSNCKTETLLSGYSPQCNPCLQEAPAVYHDHILGGLPSNGSSGTYHLIVVAYAPSFSGQANFSPLRAFSAIAVGESVGDFARINPAGANPFEMSTTTVLTLSVYPSS